MPWYSKIIIIGVKCLKVVAKCCLDWISFPMMPSIVVLTTFIHNTQMRYSIHEIKSNPKKMAQFSFGHKFYDLKYFELDLFCIL